jgi:hypothetical protein
MELKSIAIDLLGDGKQGTAFLFAPQPGESS